MTNEKLENDFYNLIKSGIVAITNFISTEIIEDYNLPQFIDIKMFLAMQNKLVYNQNTKGVFYKTLKNILYDYNWIVMMDSDTNIYIIHKNFEYLYNQTFFVPDKFIFDEKQLENHFNYKKLYTLSSFSDKSFGDILAFFNEYNPELFDDYKYFP